MKKTQWLTIGQVATLSELTVPTIRFYEEKELIWSTRTTGNQRRYHSSVIRRLAIIKIAQRVGISLQELKLLFMTLPHHKSATKKDWEKMSKQWHEQLNVKIEILLL